MYKYTQEQLKDAATLTKIIEDFKINYVPRFALLERYYRANNMIKERTMSSEKPNNKIAHGYAKYITNMAAAYFMGKPIVYSVDEPAFKDALDKVLYDNYTNDGNFETAKEASKKGIAFELMFIDENRELRYTRLSAEKVIPIYSQNIGEFLEAAIRLWDMKEADGSVTDYCEVYNKSEMVTYRKNANDTVYREKEREINAFGDIPIIIYWNNEEQTGDYEDVITLIDAYDKAQSDTANDFEYFTDAYLTIVGAGGGIEDFNGNGSEDGNDSETIKTLKEERILFLNEHGQANWLIKNINDTAVENYKNRLHKDIFFISQIPAMTDESFAGNLTGVALRYKFTGLEQLSAMKENKFAAAQKKKLRIITDFINTKRNTAFDADDITLKFERNFIDNLTETIENAAKLEGIISKETQLSLLPFVNDPKEEMERMDEETARAEGLPRVTPDVLAVINDKEW